jgi:Sec-independent protein secretion pathway component TatC
MELEDAQLKKFKMLYLVLTVLIGLIGVIIAFLTGDRIIGYIFIAIAAFVMLGGSIMYARLFRNRKLKGFD